MENLQSLVILLAIYGALWGANTILSIRNNVTAGYKFEWGIFWNGVIKAGLGALALTIGAIAINFIPQVFTSLGVVVDDATAQAISMLGVVGSVGAGVIVYARKFVKSTATLFGADAVDVALVLDKSDFNKGTIVYMDKTNDATDRELLIAELLKNKKVTLNDVKDGVILPVVEAGKGSGDTYPSYWKNPAKDTLVDRYTCYNRECVSYAGWKVEEAYGYIVPRGGSMNAKEWVRYAGLWGVQLTNEAGVGSVGISTAGDYGHALWVEEVNGDGTITVSEYNYGYNGNYNRRRMSTAGYRYLRFDLKYRPAPTPAPAPAPVNTGDANAFAVGDKVEVINPVDTKGTHLATSGSYDVIQISNGSVVIGRGGAIIARIYPANLRKVSAPAPTPAPAPIAEPATGFNVGDVVAPTRLVSYDGIALTQWDDTYTISEIRGDRAVLVARGVVWSAMKLSDLRKA